MHQVQQQAKNRPSHIGWADPDSTSSKVYTWFGGVSASNNLTKIENLEKSFYGPIAWMGITG